MKSPGAVAFSIFGFDIMWYALFVTAGIAVSCSLIYHRGPRHGINKDRTLSMILLILIAGIVGLRAYYVAFRWDYYSVHPGEIFNYRGGGLAIHGGLIGGTLMGLILCKLYKENAWNVFDLCFACVPIGQAIGRWGNFFNSEAHGPLAPGGWPFYVVVDGQHYHATFLYESVWCLLLFFLLMYIDGRRRFKGQVFLLYWILYSAERFVVEGMRTDSLYVTLPFGQYKIAQVVSLVAAVCALVVYVIKSSKRRSGGASRGRGRKGATGRA